jgi:hypothetical protein
LLEGLLFSPELAVTVAKQTIIKSRVKKVIIKDFMRKKLKGQMTKAIAPLQKQCGERKKLAL